jgi:hypothetical protein
MNATKPQPKKARPASRVGLDHIALVQATAGCTPQDRHHAQEIRARLHLTVAAPQRPSWSRRVW